MEVRCTFCAESCAALKLQHVARNQVRRQRMLEAIQASFLGWQARSLSERLEDAKKCSAMEPEVLLRREKEIRAMSLTSAQPCTQSG
jgi:hypothetical protein